MAGTLDSSMLRPTVMDVNLDALAKNAYRLKELVRPAKLMAVVKANAYGHGLIPCARLLERCGVDAFGVALLEEGVELRQAGVNLPILVFGGILGSQIKHFLDYDLDLTASSIAKLEAIEESSKSAGKRARVHLKIDSGMERIGVHFYSAQAFLTRARACKNCDVVGVFSHFARADELSLDFTREQLQRFRNSLLNWPEAERSAVLRHIANTVAALRLPESHLDLVRIGIGLYGVSPYNSIAEDIGLEPVMSLRSQVVYFKVVRRGAGVGYGHRWQAPNDTRLVTVPIGYGDGFFRELANRGSVLIRGKRYPIVGAVAMDQMMVDIGEGEAYNGDEVVLLGSQGTELITVAEIAETVGTVPHEVLSSTNLRVPRRYHFQESVYNSEEILKVL